MFVGLRQAQQQELMPRLSSGSATRVPRLSPLAQAEGIRLTPGNGVESVPQPRTEDPGDRARGPPQTSVPPGDPLTEADPSSARQEAHTRDNDRHFGHVTRPSPVDTALPPARRGLRRHALRKGNREVKASGDAFGS
jgi:hypothetical protein